jgi:hypothetical protein
VDVQGPRVSVRKWLDRFQEKFGVSATDLSTELGLFYERHRKSVQYQHLTDPDHPEYTDEEWDRVMGSFLPGPAREFGLVHAPGREGHHELGWFWLGAPQAPAATIRVANRATDSILTEDIPRVRRRPGGTGDVPRLPKSARGKLDRRRGRHLAGSRGSNAFPPGFDARFPAPYHQHVFLGRPGALEGFHVESSSEVTRKRRVGLPVRGSLRVL